MPMKRVFWKCANCLRVRLCDVPGDTSAPVLCDECRHDDELVPA